MAAFTSFEIFGADTRLTAENFGQGFHYVKSGQLVDLSKVISVTRTPCCPTTETVTGVTYPRVYMTGSMSFSAIPFTVPAAATNTTRFFETPFTMSGRVSGFADADFTAPLFAVDLTGAGTATLGPARAVIGGDPTLWLNDTGVVYSFAPDPPGPNITPEPATLGLIALGFGLLRRLFP